MRFWFLTSTTYGTWLPGDERGFVSSVRQPIGPQARNNTVNTPYDADHRGLREQARSNQRFDTVWLSRAHAEAIASQFHETAKYRNWTLHAFSVSANHFHILVEVPDDPDPAAVLQAFKSYASRRLNREFDRREAWWSDSGSKRKKADERSIYEAVRYVRDQENPHVVWLNRNSRFAQKLPLFDTKFPKHASEQGT